MTSHERTTGGGGFPWRIIGWSIPAFLLLVPLVAMRVTDEVKWTASDFIFAGVLFCGVGVAFELIVRKSGNLAYCVGAALAVLAAFLTIWANAAIGMIGSEDNPYNFVFAGVLLVALIGAIIARAEPGGMWRAMVVTALAQAAAGAFGWPIDARGAIFSMMFAGPWLLAAALFRKAQGNKR